MTDRDALARFPNHVDTDDLRRCFTLAPHDFAEVIDRRYGDGARVAAGVQIGALRLLGFAPDDLSTVPDEVLAFGAAGWFRAYAGPVTRDSRAYEPSAGSGS